MTCAEPAPCADQVVVDAVLWSGDSWTATTTLTILGAVERLRAVYAPSATFEPLARDPEHRCDGGIPPQAWQGTDGFGIGRVLVYATTAERERFEGLMGSSGLSGTWTGRGARSSSTPSSPRAGFAVDNLLVEVRVASTPNAADEALVASVTQALRDHLQP